jgi:serine/threonine protein kinase
MEKVSGADLYEVLQSGAPLTVAEAKAILYRILEAVQDLHSKGCIHKDIKLENVMIDSPTLASRNSWSNDEPNDDVYSEMAVKLIDFDTIEAFNPKMISKNVVGTDQYIAQEAYAGHYSPASDMFSVGVMAYRLITGRFPFWNFAFDDWPGENRVGSPKMREIQERLRAFPINFELESWPDLPEAKDLVRWMLQSSEADRPTAEHALAHPFFHHS